MSDSGLRALSERRSAGALLEAEGRPGVFEGANPLHQAPSGAAATAAGGRTQESARKKATDVSR